MTHFNVSQKKKSIFLKILDREEHLRKRSNEKIMKKWIIFFT